VRQLREKQISRRQEGFIALLLQHTSSTKAAEAAGVPMSTAWRWFNQPEFNDAYRVARRKLTENATRVFQSYATACAAKLVRMALDVTLPPGIQFAAASRVLDLAYRGQELEDILVEIAELRELIEAVPEPKPMGKWKLLAS
jgi:hypothetical protein